jgi:hypothetical protein
MIDEGQDRKGLGRMPWHWEPMKDVANYEKLRGGVSSLRYADIRMRKLTWGKPHVSYSEYIAV